MPQPKPTLLDRLFGAKRREPVPRAARAAKEKVRATSKEPQTAKYEPTLREFCEDPEAATLPPSNRLTPTELKVIKDKEAMAAALNHSIAMEQALWHAQQQQQQQPTLQQQQAMMGSVQNHLAGLTGMSAPQLGHGPDPDPRKFLPHWKRHYGDLGRNFNGGGK